MSTYMVRNREAEKRKIRDPTAQQREEIAAFGLAFSDLVAILDREAEVQRRIVELRVRNTSHPDHQPNIQVYTTHQGYTTIQRVGREEVRQGMTHLHEAAFMGALCASYDAPVIEMLPIEDAVARIHFETKTARVTEWQQAQRWYKTHGWTTHDPPPYAFAGVIAMHDLYGVIAIGPSDFVREEQLTKVCGPLNFVPIGSTADRFETWKALYTGIGKALHEDTIRN